MNLKKYLVCAVSTVGCTILFSQGSAKAVVKIVPKVHTGVQYDSNYWKADDDEVGVVTYFAKPGITVGVETPKLSADFDGTLDLYSYDDQDTPPVGVRDASDDNYVGTTINAQANYQMTDRLNVGISDNLYVTRDPANSDRNSNSISRDKYTVNYVEPSVYYDFTDKFGAGANYRNTYTDYEKDLEDSNEHRGIFDFYYYLNSRQSIYIDYSVWNRNYDQDSSDYTSNFVSLNYKHQFSFITLTGGGGYHNRSFDDDTMDDLDMFSWRIQAEGMDQDTDRRTTRRYLYAEVGQEMNDDGTGDSYYTASFIRFEGAYRFWDKIEGILKAGIQNSDYETEDRDDDTYYSSLGVAYRPLEFLTIGLEGGFENRDSNVDGLDYDDAYILCKIDIDYDLGSR